MKRSYSSKLSTLLIATITMISSVTACSNNKTNITQELTNEATIPAGLKFTNWLKEFIPSAYPGVEIVDNVDWYQAVISELDLTISWAFLPHEQLTLKEVHGHYEGKSLFILEPKDYKWTNANIEHTVGAGYYLPSYDSSSMGDFEVAKLSVVQFRGSDARQFVNRMNKAWLSFSQKEDQSEKLALWLKNYIPSKYSGVEIADHGHWYQAVIPEEAVTVSWAFLTDASLALKNVHGLYENKSLFISEKEKVAWSTEPSLAYMEDAGYYIAKYDSSKMGDFEVAKHTVIQFDGDGTKFTKAMAQEWAKQSKKTKFRVMMTSDFPPIGVVKSGDVPLNQKSDPDDMQSMVRFLLYANEFDIEGLIASAGTFAMTAEKKNILEVLDEYEKVYDNLNTYDSDYPTADFLRSVTYEGRANNHGLKVIWGKDKQPFTEIIGEGLDSEASNAIIAAVDKPDPRPLWIGVWGGPREVAQAIWDVKNTRTESELKDFIGKLRVFLIAYQDATHGWLMNEFPELFIIDSRKTYLGMFGGDDPKSDLGWINENIRNNHGPLCDIYPHEGMGCTGVCEGDSPAFMYLLSANRGINDPEDPTQPSWGGQYVRKEGTNHYVDGPGGESIAKWRDSYQKEFLELADRCIAPKNDRESASSLAFEKWLYEYIPTEYPNAKMTDHGGWLQAHISGQLVANWAKWNESGVTLKDMEAHALENGEAIFIEKTEELKWKDHQAVTYYEEVGYFISEYHSETMGSWVAEKCNVIQFDGDPKKFIPKMVQDWEDALLVTNTNNE